MEFSLCETYKDDCVKCPMKRVCMASVKATYTEEEMREAGMTTEEIKEILSMSDEEVNNILKDSETNQVNN